MRLIAIVLLPFVGGILAWMMQRRSPNAPRWISIGALAIDFVLLLGLWMKGGSPDSAWIREVNLPWIPELGISLHLAVDGLSLLLLLLTAFLGIISVITSWTEIQDRVGFFHFNLLWVLGGIMGVFVAMDLFLFSFLWEMMLAPMYFLIAIWGHERRIYAAVKFFLFTQLSGLLMLVAILYLYVIHGRQTGAYTFDYTQLLGTTMPPATATWIMLGFLVAFLVKLPAVPFHNWLPDAHTEAPTAGSVILAGLLLKTGAYGLIRFAVPLFPQAAHDFAPIAMALGVVGILYGALCAFAQTDLKRLVAYSSVSHMGFVLLGVFAWNTMALQGAVMQMICHGLGTGALFILVGALQERIHTRNIDVMGGLWSTVPRMGAVGIFFAMASLGLPGLGNFIAEFLILAGAYKATIPACVFASFGLVFGTIYSLWIVQRVFHGAKTTEWRMPDLGLREMGIMAALMMGLLWLGLYPQPVLDTAQPALARLQRSAEGGSKEFAPKAHAAASNATFPTSPEHARDVGNVALRSVAEHAPRPGDMP